MHRHEIAQGFSEECQARSTDLSGDPFVDRTHPNPCDYEERHASVLLSEQENTLPAGGCQSTGDRSGITGALPESRRRGVRVTTGHRGGTAMSRRASSSG